MSDKIKFVCERCKGTITLYPAEIGIRDTCSTCGGHLVGTCSDARVYCANDKMWMKDIGIFPDVDEMSNKNYNVFECPKCKEQVGLEVELNSETGAIIHYVDE